MPRAGTQPPSSRDIAMPVREGPGAAGFHPVGAWMRGAIAFLDGPARAVALLLIVLMFVRVFLN